MAGKRELTEAQKAALARGRAKIAQKRAAAAGKAPAKRTASASPAKSRRPSPAVPDAPASAPTPTTTPASSGASSSASPAPALDADALSVFFESDPTDAEGQPSSGGVLGAILGTSAGPSATTAKSVKPDKKEEDVARATDEWQEVAAQLFVLVGGWVASKELAPTTPEAERITRPLIRILMRHYDPAREASNDVLDLVAASVAMAYYLDRVGPAWANKRAEEKVKALRGDNRSHPTAKPVPIERGERAEPARPAGVAATGPTGPAGLHPDAIRRDAGAIPSGSAATRGHQPADQFNGEAVIEELTYGPLIPVA